MVGTPKQQAAVEFWQGYNVPASWFIGVPDADGTVEIVAIGKEDPFIWSFLMDAEGEASTMEARHTEFETGLSL